jgi:hypothetical protein
MTAKQKAFDLIEKFKNIKTPIRKGSELYAYMSKDMAIECSIISVSLIENALTEYGNSSMELQNMDSEWRFLDDIKQELNNEKETPRRQAQGSWSQAKRAD